MIRFNEDRLNEESVQAALCLCFDRLASYNCFTACLEIGSTASYPIHNAIANHASFNRIFQRDKYLQHIRRGLSGLILDRRYEAIRVYKIPRCQPGYLSCDEYQTPTVIFETSFSESWSNLSFDCKQWLEFNYNISLGSAYLHQWG